MDLYCSFCGKNEHEVRKLIVGPAKVAACDECVELFNDILALEKEKNPKCAQPTDNTDIEGTPV